MLSSLLSLALAALAVLSPSLLSSASAQANPNTTLTTFTLYDFESPPGTFFAYNPAVTALQPWTWSGTQSADGGGIAGQGSPFDPPGNNKPPHNTQYAFIQTNAAPDVSNMSAVLTGLDTSTQYTVTFYIGTRVGGNPGQPSPNQTQSQVFLFYGNQQVWASVPNISDSNGYSFVQTDPFTPLTTSDTFTFNVVAALNSDDHSILIDALLIAPAGVSPNSTLAVGALNSFDTPVMEGNYDYNPPELPDQPWVWTAGLGGRAKLGSPFDPPAPSAPPSGNQYAFLQTAPNGAGATYSQMSVTLSGLDSGSSYTTSFYWAVRSTGSANVTTQSQFSVVVNGQVVFQSPQNVSDAGGWTQVTTGAWTPTGVSNGLATMTFYVQATSLEDHAVLFDSITVAASSAPGGGGGGGAGGSSSSSAASVSSGSSSSASAPSAASSSAASSSAASTASASSSSSAASAGSAPSCSSASAVGVASSSSASSAASGASSSASAAAASSSSSSAAAGAGSSSSAASTPSSSSAPVAASSSSAASSAPASASSSSTGTVVVASSPSAAATSAASPSSSTAAATSTPVLTPTSAPQPSSSSTNTPPPAVTSATSSSFLAPTALPSVSSSTGGGVPTIINAASSSHASAVLAALIAVVAAVLVL